MRPDRSSSPVEDRILALSQVGPAFDAFRDSLVELTDVVRRADGGEPSTCTFIDRLQLLLEMASAGTGSWEVVHRLRKTLTTGSDLERAASR